MKCENAKARARGRCRFTSHINPFDLATIPWVIKGELKVSCLQQLLILFFGGDIACALYAPWTLECLVYHSDHKFKTLDISIVALCVVLRRTRNSLEGVCTYMKSSNLEFLTSRIGKF